ncbi:MAG: HEAT repeat domain-containing protein, partial [Pirellulaceae bacterium]
KPLLEALTKTGSGRLEVIRNAWERGVFNDLRLIKPSLAALDDSYAEIADFVADKVLPLYGKAIWPDLRATIDIQGRGGHPRRLALMHHIDPAATGPLVKAALDSGSKEVKVTAIECLGTWPQELHAFLQPLSYLLEQVRAKAKEVRQAALKALARRPESEAIAALEAALHGSDLSFAAIPIRESTHPQLLQSVLTQADAQLTQLLACKDKDKKVAGKQVERMLSLLECLVGKSNSSVEAFLLKCFAVRDTLRPIPGEPGGKDVLQRLVQLMGNGPPPAQTALAVAHASLEADELALAFVAACRVWTAADTFDAFSPYMTAKVDTKKRKRDPAAARREAIIAALRQSYRRRRFESPSGSDGEINLAQLDPRWLDLAVLECRQQGDLVLSRPGRSAGPLELVLALARPDHSDVRELLARVLEERLKKPSDLWECSWILETMVRIQHPDATDATIAALEKFAQGNQAYGLHWIGELIPQLPKEAVPRLEKLLPALPDKVADLLWEYVNELKTGTGIPSP